VGTLLIEVPMISYPLPVGACQTRILEAGEGDRHILFIHGLGARADRWAATAERFAAAGYHSLVLDLPGHGFASKGGAFDYSVPAFAKFCCGVLDELGLKRVALVGTSLGAHIAATICTQHPERVVGLSMVGAVGLAPVSEATRAAIRENIGRTSVDAIRGKLSFVMANPSLITDAWVREEWRINTSAGAAESFSRLGDYFFNCINQDAVAEELCALTGQIPMQLLWGALDNAVPVSVGEEASRLLGGIPLGLVPAAGHAPYVEKPIEFDALLRPFLDGLAWQ
jgi:pyruvate dehydrogenase E2 component (dihydrolipoamide acetyltransferase)